MGISVTGDGHFCVRIRIRPNVMRKQRKNSNKCFFFYEKVKKTRDFCERTDTSQIVYRIEYFYYYSVLQ